MAEEDRRTGEADVEPAHLGRMVSGAHGEVGRQLDDVLPVSRRLAEALPDVRAPSKRIPGRDEQRAAPRAVGDASPAPHASTATEAQGHRHPARDLLRREVDADHLPDHRAVAVGARAEVDGAVYEGHRPPDQLSPMVRVELDRPSRTLRAGDEVERVQAPERISDVERVRCRVDDPRAGDPVTVDLLADAVELGELDPPADVAVLTERVDDAPRGRHVDRSLAGHRNVLGDECLRADAARDRRVPRGPKLGGQERRLGHGAPRGVVAVGEPPAGNLSLGPAADEQEDECRR